MMRTVPENLRPSDCMIAMENTEISRPEEHDRNGDQRGIGVTRLEAQNDDLEADQKRTEFSTSSAISQNGKRCFFVRSDMAIALAIRLLNTSLP